MRPLSGLPYLLFCLIYLLFGASCLPPDVSPSLTIDRCLLPYAPSVVGPAFVDASNFLPRLGFRLEGSTAPLPRFRTPSAFVCRRAWVCKVPVGACCPHPYAMRTASPFSAGMEMLSSPPTSLVAGAVPLVITIASLTAALLMALTSPAPCPDWFQPLAAPPPLEIGCRFLP